MIKSLELARGKYFSVQLKVQRTYLLTLKICKLRFGLIMWILTRSTISLHIRI